MLVEGGDIKAALVGLLTGSRSLHRSRILLACGRTSAMISTKAEMFQLQKPLSTSFRLSGIMNQFSLSCASHGVSKLAATQSTRLSNLSKPGHPEQDLPPHHVFCLLAF
jgi:hypothetical protein